MEPIRPDEDELRAEKRDDKPAANKSKPKAEKPVRSKSSAGVALPLTLLVIAGAGAFGWFQQEQRIAQLESQLEEADYWARQSKLALARFEGELSETGENLQEAGQSIEETLKAHGERLNSSDSEIRKLWGVTNDRNKKRLNDHEARLESASKAREEAEAARESLAASLSETRETLSGQIETATARIDGELSKQGNALADSKKRLAAVNEKFAGIEKQVDNQLVRFEREQKLRVDGLEGRVLSLEKTAATLSGQEIAGLDRELAALKQTVSAIDASRAQLTSRLIRLSEQVDQLRASSGGATQ